MTTITVLPIGEPVTLGGGDIPATISAISIRGKQPRITYEVTFWDGRTRKQEWVDPEEIQASPSVVLKAMRIGFGKGDMTDGR